MKKNLIVLCLLVSGLMVASEQLSLDDEEEMQSLLPSCRLNLRSDSSRIEKRAVRVWRSAEKLVQANMLIAQFQAKLEENTQQLQDMDKVATGYLNPTSLDQMAWWSLYHQITKDRHDFAQEISQATATVCVTVPKLQKAEQKLTKLFNKPQKES